jgi:hypothetical protein
MTKVEPLILQFANNQYARAFDEPSYGFALFLADLMGVHLVLNRAAILYGGLIWPILLTVILFRTSGKVWRVISPLVQRILLALLVSALS